MEVQKNGMLSRETFNEMGKMKKSKSENSDKSELSCQSSNSMESTIIPIDKSKFNQISDEYKKFFEKVHHIYELNKKELKCRRWDDAEVEQIISKCGLQLSYNKRKTEFVMRPAKSNDINYKVWSGKSIAKNFIRHIRNSETHMNIETTNVDGEIHLQDWTPPGKGNNGKAECTMDAKMQFTDLKELVSTLLSVYWDK